MWAVKRALKPAAQFGAAAAYRQVRAESRDVSTTRIRGSLGSPRRRRSSRLLLVVHLDC
jgi:hypothetical protein